MTDDHYGPTQLSQAYQPRVNARANSHGPTTRNDLHSMVSDRRVENPTLWDAVGYPTDTNLDKFETHWLRYERQGTARGLIDKPANDTWQEPPDIVDDTAESEDQTDFEAEVERFMDGETLRREPLHRFNVVDRLATLGHYALLVLGFDDGRDLSTPVAGVADDEDGEFDGLDDLQYIATFGEDRVVDVDIVTDMTDPRFRLPESYELVTSSTGGLVDDDEEETTEEVHWSRVIHVPQGTLENDLWGTPYLKPIFHNLVNIDKILAGSAEGYWRSGYAGMVLSPPRGPNGELLRFNDADGGTADSSDLQNEIEQYEKNLKRTIATTGEVETLDPAIADPESHINQQYKEIALCKDAPQSILMGNETGERATSEDASMWKEHISSRRTNFAESVIITPLINRLIDVGILPTPNGDGSYAYSVEWPPLDELSEPEQAEVAGTLATALKELTGGQPDRIATRGELRSVMDWEPALGSEVDDDAERVEADFAETDAADADGDPAVDEQDDEIQAAFDEQQSGTESTGES